MIAMHDDLVQVAAVEEQPVAVVVQQVGIAEYKVPVPLDQQRIEPALNSVVFRPGKGRVLQRLPA